MSHREDIDFRLTPHYKLPPELVGLCAVTNITLPVRLPSPKHASVVFLFARQSTGMHHVTFEPPDCVNRAPVTTWSHIMAR